MTSGRRVHERYDRRLRVVVRHPEGEVETVSKNISLGGMYLITENQLPYGTQVKLEFFMSPLKSDVSIDAVVRWQKSDGMGVQFGSLRAKEVWAFNQLFKESQRSDD